MSDVDDLTRENRGVSRRTLVRAGAHAAWVVPAVTVISAAPAMAISNALGTITFTSNGAATVSKKSLSLSGTQLSVKSSGTGGGSTTLTMVVTFPVAITQNAGGNPTAPTGGAAANWSTPVFTGSGTAASPYTATYTQLVTGTTAGLPVAFSPAAYNVASNATGTNLTLAVSNSGGYTNPPNATVPIN